MGFTGAFADMMKDQLVGHCHKAAYHAAANGLLDRISGIIIVSLE